MFALPCLVTKSGRATSSATVSSSPRGTEAGGDGGGGVFGLLRLGAGGVGGWCGDLSRPVEIRAGPCRRGRLGAVVHVQQVGASGAQALGCTLYGVPADSSGALPFA